MQETKPFPRTARFTLRRQLGAGGFGVVFEADDRERGTRVALKTLLHLDAAALYGFKREFRALCDVVHPNLVALHELISDGDQWFFTMDLVEGTDFLAFVRDDASLALAPTLPLLAIDPPGSALSAQTAPAEPDPRCWLRLRSALAQLAEGILALHGAGKLHRDLKPSNVLVTRAGKVVILDFGLVVDLSPGADDAGASQLAGTPAYMAPEQALGEPPSPAADWYAVGVMLYEALTGRQPFTGSAFQILMRKHDEDPPPPSALSPGIPADLDALCVELLRRLPGARPTGEEVLGRLTSAGAAPEQAISRPAPSVDQAPFVGRERHLAALRDAFARAKDGHATTVHVRGTSGMGKSALVRHFLDELARSADNVFLEGRCYEREAVPYKAVDNLIDALSRYLSSLSAARAAELMPRDAQALVRLFPVLDRVPAIAATPRRGALPPDAQELRRRGFAALRELFGRIAARGPLVLHIDDLQWGDADSAALLADLLREPDAPALLLLVGYRSEDAEKSDMLRSLPAPRGDAGDAAVRDLVVGALEREEALALARSVLGAAAAAEAEAVVDEAGGSPFFVHELARAVRDRSATAAREIRLGTVLAERLARVPADARCLLEVVSVAGKPLGRRVARDAAALHPEQERAAMDVLRAARLLRSRGAGEDAELETFHDRIRETVVAALGAEALAGRHLRIAEVLEASEGAEPDALALHFRRAGRPEKAVPYAIQAGDRAALALAFDRAAARYADALEAMPGDAGRRRDLRIKLGDALRNAGRGAEAAKEYTEAAKGAPRRESLELRRRAAEQLLVSGHLDEGRRALDEVLTSVGVVVLHRRWMVILSVLFWRLSTRLYDRSAPERGARVTAETSARMEACWSAAVGLAMVDPLAASAYHARYFWLALRAGEPYHLARALAVEIGSATVDDAADWPRVQRTHRRAEALANALDDPYLTGLHDLWIGVAEYLTARWRDALAHCQAAEALWQTRCTGVTWELATARLILMAAHYYRGDLRKLAGLALPLAEDAEARGDLFAATWYRVAMTYMTPLAGDRPGAARDEVRNAMSKWSQREFTTLQFWEMMSLGRIDLYAGEPLAARARIETCWPRLLRSFLLRNPSYRMFCHHLRASVALAAAAASEGTDERLFRTLLREADRDVRRLPREDVPCTQALADSLRAPLALLRGDAAAALALLDRAAAGFDACEMALFAACARRRRGVLLRGDEGRALVEGADRWMASQGIGNPARMTALFAPGFRG